MSEIICFYNYASGDETSTGYFMLESNVGLNDFKQFLVQSNIMTADQIVLDSNNQPLESEEEFASMKQFAETNDTPISITIVSQMESKEAVPSEPAVVLSEDEPFGPLSKQILTSFKIDYNNITQLDDIINAIPFPFSMMARAQLANIREKPETIEQIVSYLAPELAVEASPLVAEVKHTFAYFDRKERERQEKERQENEQREAELARQELARQQERELEMARHEKEQRERQDFQQEQANEREFIGPVMKQLMEKVGIEIEIDAKDVPTLVQYLPSPFNFFVARAIKELDSNINGMDHCIRSFAQNFGLSGETLVDEVHYAFNCFKEATKKVKEEEEEEVKEVVKEVNQVRHHAICDNCQTFICGIRYKCLHCPDYDLCSACEEVNTNQSFHDESHVFAKIHTPASTLPFSSRVPGRMAACHAMRSMRQNRIATLETSVEELKKAVAALSENKM